MDMPIRKLSKWQIAALVGAIQEYATTYAQLSVEQRSGKATASSILKTELAYETARLQLTELITGVTEWEGT